ncbi:hypothetical protein NHP190003_03350 [Helicobacter sp. NHP19-003]|uniref:Uncharacterized protein n=1 Tax=Helicobacter gastrocanis TaxID=2849641 RepID=A0ABM7S965_9HELI|nr:hypothetical protein [Helicobacter sp. NHP19-003]BCZ17053.1 hypothetical protein NHP190003_03350 [Helicobacter sp. NHP19-003]
MKITLHPFKASEFLDTDEIRMLYLNAVIEDGNVAELKDTLAIIAESKGVELPALEGESWLLEALRKLGLGVHFLDEKKDQSA